jgi:ketol-acid reductoisomerase
LKIFHDNDADLKFLDGKTIAVIGFGAQGKAQAQCLKDSGINVVLGLRLNGESWQAAKSLGFEVLPVKEAAERADIIHILIPDEVQGEVYEKEIKQAMKKSGKTLSFSHGFNIIFNRIVPEKTSDVIMVAPKSPGTEERKRFVEGFGVPGLVAVQQDASGKAKQTALAMAKACGFTRAGVLECSFEQEAFEDLFGEQTVLCGGVTELIKAGFDTLTDAGYPPEMAYFECLHEMKLIVDLIYEGGIERMYDVVSNTAEYGGRTRGTRIIGKAARKEMKKILKEVESGKFAKEWMKEYENGLPNFKKWREEAKESLIEKTGKEIRAMFEQKK